MLEGLFYLIATPIIGVLSGLIWGPLYSWLYNVVAGWVGGIELGFEE